MISNNRGMTLTQKQLSIWAAIALMIMLMGVWYGEKPSGFGGSYFALLMGFPIIIVLMFVLSLIIKQKWFVQFFVGIAFLILFVVSFLVGSGRYQDAFNNCVNHGEAVRAALQQYYQANKMYPKNLLELNIQLPGKLFLHPNILQYETTKHGYLLRFDDHFIVFESTESQPFEPNK